MSIFESLEAVSKIQDGLLPRIPKPTSLTQLPPPSEIIISATTTDKLNVLWDSDHNSDRYWVVDPDPTNTSAPNNALPVSMMPNRWGGRPDYTLSLRRYWQVLDWTLIDYQSVYTKTVAETYGVSSTETTTMAFEVGVEFSGISGKFSKSFETSTTVSSETSTQDSWGYTNNNAGTKAFAILWQLVEEFVALDVNGNVVEPWVRGSWTADLELIPGMGAPGALIILQTNFVSPTSILVQDITSFNV